ncbi:MAG: YCF48-related protein [Bacteroidota bacterium]
MKTLKILSIVIFSSISLMACSEKKEGTVTPITPTTPTEKSTFFNDPIMKKANLISVSFSNDQTLFAFGNDSGRGYLFKSTDTGKTWAEVSYSPLNPLMNVVSFYDEKVGIIGGNTILGTNDGGATWATIPQLSNAIQKVTYPKSQQGFMVKLIFDAFHSRKYTELYAVNTTNLTTDNNYVTLDGYTNDLHFLRNKIGILVGDLGNVYIITVKADGTFEYSDRLRPVSEDLLSVFMVNEKIAFVGGKNNIFLKTIDAGTTWTNLKILVTGNVKKIVFQNENLGYGIVENEGKTALYKIEESGQKWTKFTTTDAVIFNDLKINSQGKAIAVGEGGGVYLF